MKSRGVSQGCIWGGGGVAPPPQRPPLPGELLPHLDFWKVDIPKMETTSLYAVHALVHIKNTQKRISVQAHSNRIVLRTQFQIDSLHGFLFRTSKIASTLSCVSFSGNSIAIFIRCESLPSEREFHRHVLITFILEKLLSTETVETGVIKQIEATLCKFGDIVTSISSVMSSLSWNAMLPPGLFASKVRKGIHSVCTSGGITADFTVSSPFNVRAGLSFP